MKPTKKTGMDEPPTAPEPADFAAARQLHAAVLEVNSGAATRTKLTTSVTEALADLQNRFQELSDVEQTTLRINGSLNETSVGLGAIGTALDDYITLTTDVKRTQIANVWVDMPSIESDAVRLVIQRAGEKILQEIDSYIAERQRRINRLAERERAEDEAFETAMSIPILKSVILLYIDTFEFGKHFPDVGMLTQHVQNAMYVICLFLTGAEQLPESVHQVAITRSIHRKYERGLLNPPAAT